MTLSKKQALEKFLSEVAKEEGGKYQARYADIKQIVKIIDRKLSGIVYAAILAVEKAKQ